VTVSADGTRVAWAFPSGSKGQSEIHRSAGTADSDETTTVRGQLRDLLFLQDGRLLALLHRPAKKWEGDTHLVSWAPGTQKVESVMRLPPSSSDLDHWPARNGIVIACRNEIRTLLEPDLRSGPVFMVPGTNLALTTLGSSSFVWVGQDAGLFLVDLDAPSGREPMTVLAQQPVPAPVAELADFPDGSTTLVRLADGRLYRAALDPPGFEAGGSARHIVRLAKSTGGPPIASAERRPAPAPAVVAVAALPEEPDVPAPKPVPEPEVAPETPVGTAVEQPKTEPPAAPLVEEPAATAEPDPVDETRPAYQLHGRIRGTVALVHEIVLLGPDNILLEAARLRPDEQGRWGIEHLAPGRYRVQVDGGGDRVLVADPRFVIVEVGTEPKEAPEITIRRAF
jgi:hypothetical protein